MKSDILETVVLMMMMMMVTFIIIVLFSTLEQTHCACMWFCMSD